MIVLDTTILLYAVGGDHPFQPPCLRLLERAQEGVVEATTTVEVIQEFAHIRSRRRSRQEAAELARNYVRLLTPLLTPTPADVADGLGVFETEPGLGSFDSVLAATSLRRSAQLASADHAFAAVRGLHHVAPGTPEFDALLG